MNDDQARRKATHLITNRSVGLYGIERSRSSKESSLPADVFCRLFREIIKPGQWLLTDRLHMLLTDKSKSTKIILSCLKTLFLAGVENETSQTRVVRKKKRIVGDKGKEAGGGLIG